MRPALAITLLFAGCVGSGNDLRSAQLRSLIGRQDEVLNRTRPALVAGKYRRMAQSPFDFYRGNVGIFRDDWEHGELSATDWPFALEPVWGLGDAHPENFGILVAGDGTAALEPNDFDSADRVPALFDLRRLCVGLALFAEHAGLALNDIRAVAGAAAQGWLGGIQAAPTRMVDPGEGDLTQDLFRRSARDLANRQELVVLTELTAGQRHFRRGPPDPEEPSAALDDLPVGIVAELKRQFGSDFKDAVRQFGSGVGSWPRVRALVLLEGPTELTDDDVVIELKEIGESALAGWYAPVLPASESAQRVTNAAHRAWARPDADPRLAALSVFDFPLLMRTESEANKGVRLSRLTGKRATVEAQCALAATLGRLLGRVQQSDGLEAPADVSGFADEQASIAVRQLGVTLGDYERFVALLTEYGPNLGLPTNEPGTTPRDFASLIGVPP